MDKMNHKCKHQIYENYCIDRDCCKKSDFFWIRNRVFLSFISTICLLITMIVLSNKIIEYQKIDYINIYHILFITGITIISCSINLLIRSVDYDNSCN